MKIIETYPAQTITQPTSGSFNRGKALIILCNPATPTSNIRSTSHCAASSVTAASSATGRSVVPAVATTILFPEEDERDSLPAFPVASVGVIDIIFAVE